MPGSENDSGADLHRSGEAGPVLHGQVGRTASQVNGLRKLVSNNEVLQRKAERLMKQARRLSRQGGQTERVYGECLYQAQTWSQPRRVIIKAEVVPGREPKDNPRFVVTNLAHSPRHI